MPSADAPKSSMNGTKRKGGPVKEPHVKKPKKAKVADAPEPVVKKGKSKSKLVTKVTKSSSDNDDDSDASNADGGVPIIEKAAGAMDIDSDDEEDEDIPTAEDGLHPERAKVVNQNSKPFIFLYDHSNAF